MGKDQSRQAQTRPWGPPGPHPVDVKWKEAERAQSGVVDAWSVDYTEARHKRVRRFFNRVFKWLAALVMLGVLAVAAGFGLLLLGTPSVADAPVRTESIAREHDAVYPGGPVPARFSTALEATEDHRFGKEPGVDPVAVARVAVGFVAGRPFHGGATLYQQLAKTLYTPGRTGAQIEAEQVALAIKLRYHYTGPQILRMYSDVVYFGHGFYGLENASCGYFGVEPAQMSWPQAALLAGLVQGPSTDDPIDDPANGRAREVHVIGRLVSVGAISQASADAFLQVPLPSLLARAGACGTSQ